MHGQEIPASLKQDKIATLESFYPADQNENYFSAFDDIRFDQHSIDIFQGSMNRKGRYSFAWMGMMYEDRETKQPYVKVFIHPTAYDIEEGIKKGFDRADIVKAQPTQSAFFGGAGAVHRDELKLCQDKQKDCKDIPLGNCGGSLFTVVTDDETSIDFVNRCNSNKLFNMNKLGLTANLFTLEKKELVPDSPNATIRIVERSVPRVPHDKFVNKFLANLTGKVKYNLNRCYAYQVEALWEQTTNLKAPEPEKALAQDIMMTLWLACAGKRGSAMGYEHLNGYEEFITNLFSLAKSNNIQLDSNFIPEKYQELGNALMVAAKKKYLTIMDTLLNNGADIYQLDKNGNNVLVHAVQSGDAKPVEKVLAYENQLPSKSKRLVDQENALGQTPLMIATNQVEQNADIIKMILEQKPDLTKLDDEDNDQTSSVMNRPVFI